MINVLVTGSNGQLGSCIKALALNHSNINFIYTDYLELDICNLDKVYAFFESQKDIHYCINCAAYTAVDKAESDVEKAFEINALGPKNLALACFKNNTTLIHVSTDFVFDGKHSMPYTEIDKPNPISVYGKSKLKGEEEITHIFNNFFIIRTSWLYSEYCQNFLITMLRLSKERKELSIVADQIGTPTYAKDLAKVILKIVKGNNKNYGTYHYSNEGISSWYDFAKAIFDIQNSAVKVHPIKTEAYPTPAKRPLFSVLNKTKIKSKLGISVPYWRDSLKAALSNL